MFQKKQLGPVFKENAPLRDSSGTPLEGLARKLMGVALTMPHVQAALKATGQVSWFKRLNPTTGIRVQFVKLPGTGQLIQKAFVETFIPAHAAGAGTCFVYMETGLLGFEDIYPCGDLGGEAATLYFSNTIAAYIALRGDAFSMIGLLKTQQAYSTYPPLASFPGSVDKAEGESDALSCDRDTYKEYVRAVPPSVFSGKLRLLVQSKYGRSDSEIQSIGTEAVIIDDQLYASSAAASYGIYTHNDTTRREYWLVRIIPTQVSVGKLRFPVCMQKLITYILQNEITGNDLATLEAYILSSALPPSEWEIIEESCPTINPLSYGWRFNANGSQAKAVTVTGSLLDGYTFSTQSLILSLQYLGSTPDWSVSTEDTVHATDVNLMNHIFLWAFNGVGYDVCTGTGTADTVSDIPVFGYWDANDEWHTETYSGGGSKDVPFIADTIDICSLTGTGHCYNHNFHYSTWARLDSASVDAGVMTITSQPASCAVTGIVSGAAESTSGPVSGYTTTIGTDTCGNRPPAPNCDVVWRATLEPYRETVEVHRALSGTTHSAFNMLIPARDDCNACYVGSWMHVTGVQQSVTGYERRKYTKIRYYCYIEPGVYEYRFEFDNPSSWATGLTNFGTLRSSGTHAVRDIKVDLHYSDGAVEVWRSSGVTDTPESASFKLPSYLGGGDAIDLNEQVDDTAWAPYIQNIPIVISTLRVLTSSVENSLLATPAPGADLVVDDLSWELPAGHKGIFVGWA